MRMINGWCQWAQHRIGGIGAMRRCRAVSKFRRASSIVRHLNPMIEALEVRTMPSVVGFVDDREYASGDADYITATGNTPRQLVDENLTPDTLQQLDALILALGNYERPETLLANFPNVLDWVHSGGKLIIHDSNPEANASQDIVPGLDGVQFYGPWTNENGEFCPSQEMNVLLPDSPIISGPYGLVDDTTLDGGWWSNHGYMIAQTLPNEVQQVMDTGADTNHIAVIQYQFGQGSVIYSTIPVEFYTNWGGEYWTDFRDRLESSYLPNELNAALTASSSGTHAVASGDDLAIPVSPDEATQATGAEQDTITSNAGGDLLTNGDDTTSLTDSSTADCAQIELDDATDSAPTSQESTDEQASNDGLELIDGNDLADGNPMDLLQVLDCC